MLRDAVGDGDADEDDADDEVDDFERDVANAPVVFVGYPHASLLCPRCRDVMRDPVCADDGSTYCRACAPAPSGEDADGRTYEADAEVEDAIASSTVICRRGLVLKRNAHGAGEWCWNAEGCGEAVRLSMRDVHERECLFACRRCPLPCASMAVAESHNLIPGRDFCGERVAKYVYASHQHSCVWQPKQCDVEGCGARVPLCKAALHAQTCPEAVIPCANECGWKGARKLLAEHRSTTCAREYVKCGFINLEEEDELGCLFGCERDGIDAHRMDCDYRPYTCPSCDEKVNAVRAARHDVVCAEARRPCPKCHALVRSRMLHAHLDNFCVGASKKCPFASFGCLECGTDEELAAHQSDDAPRHLRLVVRALDEERARGKSKTKIIEQLEASVEAMDVECKRLASQASERVRFVEEKAIEQVQRVQSRLEMTTEAFDAHVAAQAAEIAQLKIDLAHAVDADAQLTKVTSAVSHEDAEVLVKRLESHASACSAQITALREEIDACGAKWSTDLERLSTRDEETVETCRKEIDDAIKARRESDTSSKRIDELAIEIRDVQRTLNVKLMELSHKQNELNEHWRFANENPQFALTTRSTSAAPSLTVSDDDTENQERAPVVAVKPRRKFKTAAKPLGSDENVASSGDDVALLRRRKFSSSLRSARERVPMNDPASSATSTPEDEEREHSVAQPEGDNMFRDVFEQHVEIARETSDANNLGDSLAASYSSSLASDGGEDVAENARDAACDVDFAEALSRHM